MRAVIMAGGQGARMRPYTTVLPKPLLPVGDRPILAILMEQLAAAGATRIDLCLGYLSELISAYLDQAPLRLNEAEVCCHHEQEPLGTAGALRDLDALDEPFLLMNGDVLTSLDFAGLMSAHRDSEVSLTVTVQERKTELGSGVLEIADGRVRSYTEKPTYVHQVSLGIYALSPAAVAMLPEGRADVPELVCRLIEAGMPVGAHTLEGTWFDVGTPSDHSAAEEEMRTNPARYFG